MLSAEPGDEADLLTKRGLSDVQALRSTRELQVLREDSANALSNHSMSSASSSPTDRTQRRRSPNELAHAQLPTPSAGIGR